MLLNSSSQYLGQEVQAKGPPETFPEIYFWQYFRKDFEIPALFQKTVLLNTEIWFIVYFEEFPNVAKYSSEGMNNAFNFENCIQALYTA